MFNRNHVCAIAAMAVISMISLTACSDENVTSPSGESGLSSGESGDTVQINIGGFTYTFPACNAEREGTSIKKFIGDSKYGYDRYYKCEKGSWDETSAVDVECAQSDVNIGDVCPIRYYGYVGMGGPIRLSCYVYTENGWTNKGGVDFYGEDQKSFCEEVLNAPQIETGCTDGEEPKEIEKDNKVYSYICSSGEWLLYYIKHSASSDSIRMIAGGDSVQIYIYDRYHTFPACNAEREGTVEKLFVGNPKYGSDQYFKCEQGSWNAKSAIDIECNQTDAKIGDICSIDYVGYLSLGGPIRLSCYVYTEKGWTYKGYDDWYDPAYAGTCEEVLNAPQIETECTDGESTERKVDDKVYHYACSLGEWQIHDVERSENNLKCDYETKGAKTRFLVEKSGEVLKDVCSEPIPVIGDEVYAEDCNVENDGRVLSLWSGNSKYGHMSYYKCQKDSWVEGDIGLTCDTAGVAVGDTCVKQNSINVFQAGMNPTGEIVSFVYQGDGVWTKIETEEMARIDK
ncbi:MAG: hypothetical protein J6Y14_10500 [Fibrobacter sp.]|nr:hypothetical protein [Fibrobacter sp.]